MNAFTAGIPCHGNTASPGNFSVARDRRKKKKKEKKKEKEKKKKGGAGGAEGAEGAGRPGGAEAPVHLVRKAGVPVGGSQKVKGYYEPI